MSKFYFFTKYKRMKINKLIFFWGLVGIFAACEKEFVPKDFDTTPSIVVEGYIEANKDPRLPAQPAYVLLTESMPFFKELDGVGNIYVKNADVWVFSKENNQVKDSVKLTQFCWSDLTPSQKQIAAQAFGINLDSITSSFNFCVYIDILQKMQAKLGGTYDLRITLPNGKVMTSTTTIPQTAVPIDSAIFIKPPGNNQNDTMVVMRAICSDPGNERNYYRYFADINGSGYIAGSSSVTDDGFFNGIPNSLFQLSRPIPRGEEVPEGTFGLWYRGDTISVKFCNIDKAHFDFWNTLEYNSNSGGPFATPTKVRHNINGGLGIWGGYAVTYYDAIIPK